MTLAWAPNPESNVAGYKVYLGTVSGSYTSIWTVGNVTSHVFTGLVPSSTYYCAVQAYNTAGQLSTLSGQVSFLIPDAVGTFNVWAQDGGLSGSSATAGVSPFGDGLPNLVKFAFNLNASGPDLRVLPTGTGTAGLPSFSTDRTGTQPLFKVEFLRRKLSGLVYAPKVTSDFVHYSDMSGTPTVTAVDADWERVNLAMPINTTSNPRLFGRVEVTLPGLVVGQ